NIDQLNFFATYCFNAGATVVPYRPLGHQTNEVVLDNDSPNVSFAGAWSNSTSTIFFGTPGDVPYRFASLDLTETATATYTPTIPQPGFYPIYTWVRHGSDRGDQLYRIKHTGGESQVRIPHYMVGNGWVYLGEYYFNVGSNAPIGSLVISNLRGSTNGNVIIADAIRFGNGMGSIDRGGGVSGYPREDESCRYWVQAGLGVGQSSSLYDAGSNDESDSWTTPGLISAEMNATTVITNIFKRVHISFHSNATTGNTNTATARGTIGLITSDPTPNQAQLAQICSAQVDSELRALGSPPLEYPWQPRGNTYSSGYSEIDGSNFGYEMDATILEVAFHDNTLDARLLRDSKARAAIGKAAMHGVIKYMNQFDGLPLNFLPEPPTNPRAVANVGGGIALTWNVPVSTGGSGAPTNYVIYRSTNGYGFGNPLSAGNTTSITLTNLAPDTDFYFRVSAANAGGESLPSEIVGCRLSSDSAAPKILVVNAFDRFDRTTNLRQNTVAKNYVPPGNSGTIERVWPRNVNSFDYVVAHGKAISTSGLPFDSCQNEAIANGQIILTYPIVIWAAGQESINSETFSAAEQSKIIAFQTAGGNLFVSGSDVGWDLDRASGPTVADRSFYNNQLHARLNGDVNDNSHIYTTAPVNGSIFVGNGNAVFDDGNKGIYWVQTPDVITPNGTGTRAALFYNGTSSPAAIQYDGSAGGGKVVYFGFPFETITSASLRTDYMSDILNFFNLPQILTQPVTTNIIRGMNVTFAVNAMGAAPLNFQWQLNGSNILNATTNTYTIFNAQTNDAGNYSVVITNLAGSVISSNALLTVVLPAAPEFNSIILSSSNSVQFFMTGQVGVNYTIETSTNLVNWFALTNFVLINATFQFDDPIGTN
ncbi:MAG: immunoglobulin domain-containing protein, partial [Limisphaerales bacterium]